MNWARWRAVGRICYGSFKSRIYVLYDGGVREDESN